jgi:hypothetical protein
MGSMVMEREARRVARLGMAVEASAAAKNGQVARVMAVFAIAAIGWASRREAPG